MSSKESQCLFVLRWHWQLLPHIMHWELCFIWTFISSQSCSFSPVAEFHWTILTQGHGNHMDGAGGPIIGQVWGVWVRVVEIIINQPTNGWQKRIQLSIHPSLKQLHALITSPHSQIDFHRLWCTTKIWPPERIPNVVFAGPVWDCQLHKVRLQQLQPHKNQRPWGLPTIWICGRSYSSWRLQADCWLPNSGWLRKVPALMICRKYNIIGLKQGTSFDNVQWI